MRLLRLGKKQKDLLEPLEVYGYHITKDVLSRIISGERNHPDVLFAINRILREWENAVLVSGSGAKGGGLA